MFHIHHNIKVALKSLMVVVEMVLLAIAILVVDIMPVIVVGDKLYCDIYSSSGHACEGVCSNERGLKVVESSTSDNHNIQSLNFGIINRRNFGGFSSGSCAQRGEVDNGNFSSMGEYSSSRRF